jgi:uncharacterized membrane protein YhaH (DUF805 family)
MISRCIGRLEYLFWCSVPIVVGSVLAVLIGFSIGVVNLQSDDAALRRVVAPVVLIVAIIILSTEVSRFHDIGWSGWFVLLMFVPLLNLIIFLLLVLVPGQKTNNKYGDPPLLFGRLRGRAGLPGPG